MNEPSLWMNIVAGSVSGLVAGLLISLTLWAINHFSRPKFEFFEIGNGRGHFYYNRYWPIIVGGSFIEGHGPAMIEVSRRAGVGGFYMGSKHDQVFATATYPGPGLSAGETVSFTYRRAPIKTWFSRASRYDTYFYEMDPVTWFSNRKGSEPEGPPAVTKEARRWKMAHVVLKPSATKTA